MGYIPAMPIPKDTPRGEISETQVSLRLPRRTLARAEAIAQRIAAGRERKNVKYVGRSRVLRVALGLGLAILERRTRKGV